MKGIPGRHLTETAASRAIYPSRTSWYICLLICSKILNTVGIFLAYDVLKIVSVAPLVCLVKLAAGSILVYIQKPFSNGSSLTQAQWFRVVQYTLLKNFYSLLWFYGLSLCGPFRTILVTQHYDFGVITGIGALFSGQGAPAVHRGTMLFLSAIITLLFLDHDEGQQHLGDRHIFSSISSWLGLADHKFGIVLLFLLLLVQVGINAMSKRIAADVGGMKRLHSLASLCEGIVLIPWLTIHIFQGHRHLHILSLCIPVLAVAVFVFVMSYYVDAICIQRLEIHQVARVGSISMFVSALFAALFWHWPYFLKNESDDSQNNTLNLEDHILSGGSLIACVFFILASLGLTSTTKTGAKGSFVGYSATGLPLYNFTNSALHHTSRSLLMQASMFLKQILIDHNSRRIFYFLCLNLSFTVIEFLYGIWSNSLGLISDGFHMLFDCSALLMGLVAAVMARWKPSKTFSYGYSRVEDLSGFVNGLFLLVISLFVFSEAVSRLLDPPHIITQSLLAVSVGGLFVNLIGILAFRHGHQHSSHEHSGGSHGHSHNANMEGVFLHVLADTLGSVGVIVSSVLIEQFGWYRADPICSIFIAVLIFMSVLPLLKSSALVLLLRTPAKVERHIPEALKKVHSLEGVLGIRQPHFWQHSSETFIGTVHVQVDNDASEQKVIQEVTNAFKEIGFSQFHVQVEKQQFFTHMSGLSSPLKMDLGFGIEKRESLLMINAV